MHGHICNQVVVLLGDFFILHLNLFAFPTSQEQDKQRKDDELWGYNANFIDLLNSPGLLTKYQGFAVIHNGGQHEDVLDGMSLNEAAPDELFLQLHKPLSDLRSSRLEDNERKSLEKQKEKYASYHSDDHPPS